MCEITYFCLDGPPQIHSIYHRIVDLVGLYVWWFVFDLSGANQDTYDYRPPVSPTAVSGPCSVRQDTQKHPATIPFRYYKRYMEESHTAIALPSLFTGCKPVCILVQRVFFIPPGIRVIAGISRSCSSRGPPCPAV